MAQASDTEQPSLADALKRRQQHTRTMIFLILGVVAFGIALMLLSLVSGPRSVYEGIPQAFNASDHAPVLGHWQEAPVTLTVFLDFADIRSARLHKTLLQLVDPYLRPGTVVLVEYLLVTFGPYQADSRMAAEAAFCAGEQGAFWQMHDALFNLWERQFEAFGRIQAPPPAFRETAITLAAQQIQIDPAEVLACISEGRQRTPLDAGISVANALGITSVPAVYINTAPMTDESGNPVTEPTLAQLQAALDAASARVTGQ